jgi:alkaline phosphatase D
MKLKLAVFLFFISLTEICSQKIQSGPMLGYSEMREVLVWVQTTSTAKVKIRYWLKGFPKKVAETNEVKTDESTAFTAKLIADQVEPGNQYEYWVLINNKIQQPKSEQVFQTLPIWLWRTDAPDFKFAFGSCNYVNEAAYDRPGTPYGGFYEIYNSIYQKKPDFMVWGGDNVYLREPDWNSKTGIYKRYTHTRSIKELQPLLANVHHYAILDDHDFGSNDSDRSFIHKDKTLKAFEDFWGNPTFGMGGDKAAITSFTWNDCAFFLLDNRTYKSPNKRKSTKCTILGETQKEWLIDALTESKATFKFVVMGGQFLNPNAVFENYSNCASEKDTLLSLLTKENIKGVVFLTGDRHHSELNILPRPGNYPLHDFTVSPLTAGPSDSGVKEINALRVKESLVTERNFSIFQIAGNKADRQLKCTIFDSKGNEKFSYTIQASDLK